MPSSPSRAEQTPTVGGAEWRGVGAGSGDLGSAAVLVASGNDAVGSAVEKALARAGYLVTWVRSGQRALDGLKVAGRYALLVVDLALSDRRGLDVLRAASLLPGHPPLLVVTAEDSETDRVVAFELGADDFVGAPFSGRELALRVRVLLGGSRAAAGTGGVVQLGGLRLDGSSHRAWLDGRELALSLREFALLATLMQRPDHVFTRSALLERVWGQGTRVGIRAVDAYVTRLRRKLGAARTALETVSSVGYRLSRPG
ncbi:MAG: response regulator transcription factor [Deltaproteobacteria bacterium]|nr:response regulator transcription factor [Deltaproteobacteria bacterium]